MESKGKDHMVLKLLGLWLILALHQIVTAAMAGQ